MEDTLIELRNLVKIYDTGAVKVLGLNQINLKIKKRGVRSHYGTVRLRKIYSNEYLRLFG